MAAKLKKILRWIVRLTLLLPVLFIGLYYWVMLRPHHGPVKPSDLPLDYESFTNVFGSNQFPPNASNIYHASASVGLGGRAELYRFDAPASNCVAYARLLVSQNNVAPGERRFKESTNLTVLTSPPAPMDIERLRWVFGLKSLEWFDSHTISGGYFAFAPPSALGLLWVDTNRGRVYYYWTD